MKIDENLKKLKEEVPQIEDNSHKIYQEYINSKNNVSYVKRPIFNKLVLSFILGVVFVGPIVTGAVVGSSKNNTEVYPPHVSPPIQTDVIREVVLGRKAELSLPNTSKLNSESYTTFKNKYNNSSSLISEKSLKYVDEYTNYVLSPLSIFSALAMVTECGSSDTREEILSLYDMTYSELVSNYSILYNDLCRKFNGDTGSASCLNLLNSIWMQSGYDFKQNCIDNLSNYYYTDSCQVDFGINSNKYTNELIKSYINEQTNGLIDPDLQLSPETLCLLLNTLYLKDAWGSYDLSYTKNTYEFKNSDNEVVNTKLLITEYQQGTIGIHEKYKSFFAKTQNGYKVSFLLPNNGVKPEDIFTLENLENSITEKFENYDLEGLINYQTRVLFPAFEASADLDMSSMMMEEFGVLSCFNPHGLTSLGGEELYASSMKHIAKVKVNEKGVEGAAVTYFPICGTGMPSNIQYFDFVIDRPFVFTISWNGYIIFSGIINQIQ